MPLITLFGQGIRRLVSMALGLLILGTSASCRKRDEAFEMLQPPTKEAALPRHWQLPEFSLTERNGRKIALADLRGFVWVADFFYTTCPGPCPMMTSRLSEVHNAVRHHGEVRLVSISTDPAKDTIEVLQQYAARFNASDRWWFLTGDKAAIFDLANKGFKVSVTDEGGTEREPITHSTKLILVDKNATVRGFYEGTTPEESHRLVADIERLRKETR